MHRRHSELGKRESKKRGVLRSCDDVEPQVGSLNPLQNVLCAF